MPVYWGVRGGFEPIPSWFTVRTPNQLKYWHSADGKTWTFNYCLMRAAFYHWSTSTHTLLDQCWDGENWTYDLFLVRELFQTTELKSIDRAVSLTSNYPKEGPSKSSTLWKHSVENEGLEPWTPPCKGGVLANYTTNPISIADMTWTCIPNAVPHQLGYYYILRRAVYLKHIPLQVQSV